MAPEVFRHETYNEKVDVYAFAMIFYQLLEGYPPFYTLDPVQAARAAAVNNLRPEWGKTNRRGLVVPETLKKVVEDCWASDFDDRPDFITIVTKLHTILDHLDESDAVKSNCCCLQ